MEQSEEPAYLGRLEREVGELVVQCRDGQLRCQPAVLAAVSPLLQAALQQVDLALLPHCTQAGVRGVLDLLYQGQTRLTSQQQADELRSVLQLLRINIDIQILSPSAHHSGDSEFCEEVRTVTDDTLVGVNETPTAVTDFLSPPLKLPGKRKADKGRARKQLSCDLCPGSSAVWEGLTQLRRHTLAMHRCKPLPCPLTGCAFRADDHSKLDNHVRGVHRNHSESFKCAQCDKSFPSQSYLKTHVKRMHKLNVSEREKVCPYCGETKLQLNDHILRAHKVKRFYCDLCPKSFKTSVQKRIHINVHTGFKPYTCSCCHLSFSRLHHRKTHLERTGHTAGPVLRPPDHQDLRCGPRQAQERTEVQQQDGFFAADVEAAINTEALTKAIGVNCAEIIQNITLTTEELDF